MPALFQHDSQHRSESGKRGYSIFDRHEMLRDDGVNLLAGAIRIV